MGSETIRRLAFVLATFAFLSAQIIEFSQFPDDRNQLLLFTVTTWCENVVVAVSQLTNIDPNFMDKTINISSITCLDLTNSDVENIENGAFEKLPNLTYLDLSYNKLRTSQLFSFGSHKKLIILIMNYAAKTEDNESIVEIFDYPALEALSLRGNGIADIRLPGRILNFVHNSSMAELSLQPKIPFPKLMSLDLSRNKINDTNFVQLLPNTLVSLNLNANQLSSLTLNTKGINLFLLNLHNNKLKSVINMINHNELSSNNSRESYSSQKLENQSYLANIEDRLDLTRLENLRYLSISKNKINFIEPNAFQDTKKLIYLNLFKNYIEYLFPNTFEKLQFLTTLNLSANRFTSIPQIRANISNLYLSCNKIERIISNSFIQTPKLTKLLLGGNQISEIDSNAFAYLHFLEILDLSKNKLNFLPEKWTEPLTSLKQLDLSDNEITSLESLSLVGALSLKDVYLATNQLEHINSTYIENTLPRNLSIKLEQRSDFANWDLFCSDKPFNKESS